VEPTQNSRTHEENPAEGSFSRRTWTQGRRRRRRHGGGGRPAEEPRSARRGRRAAGALRRRGRPARCAPPSRRRTAPRLGEDVTPLSRRPPSRVYVTYESYTSLVMFSSDRVNAQCRLQIEKDLLDNETFSCFFLSLCIFKPTSSEKGSINSQR